MLRVNNSDDCIKLTSFCNIWLDEESLRDWGWVCETCRLNYNTIKIVLFCNQKTAQNFHKVGSNSAAHASIDSQDDLLFCKLTVRHKLIVDTDCTKFVFNHCKLHAMLVGQDVI